MRIHTSRYNTFAILGGCGESGQPSLKKNWILDTSHSWIRKMKPRKKEITDANIKKGCRLSQFHGRAKKGKPQVFQPLTTLPYWEVRSFLTLGMGEAQFRL